MEDFAGARSGVVLDGRYRLGGMIARGGMSTVYRGLDIRLDRAVAIKVLSPAYTADPAFGMRFEREARAAAALDHRGVVAVYDQGRDGDAIFLVMELIDGGTLRDLIHERGALDVPLTLSILEPLLAALSAAHDKGLVHRDVKPENVLISSKGEVKVADFGLAKAITSQTMATGEVILGTVAYLSPEQVATGAADARSDVYSAAVVAFEMLTGRPPYTGDNAISVAYQHVHSDVPPVTDDAPGVPLELDDLILAATRRDPAARPRNAGAFLAELISLRRRLGLPRVPIPPPRSRAVAPPAQRTTQGPTTSAAATRTPLGPGGTAMVPGAGFHPTAAAAWSREVPRRRIRRWIVAVVVLLLLGGAAALGGWWLGSGRWAYAPTSVGLQAKTAEQQVRNAGLVPVVTVAHDDRIPAGRVAGSNPPGGSRELRGSQVTLIVSTGRPRVPTVAPGSSVAIAQAEIAAAGLVPVFDASADSYSPALPAASVIGTRPTAGAELDIGTRVLVVRSKGAAPVRVPDVAGKELSDAQNALIAAGFVVGPPRNVFKADVDAGTIIGTIPATGQEEPHGSTVSLTIAMSMTVPDVRYLTVAQAQTMLQTDGFQVTVGDPVFDSDVDGGAVVGTQPASGARVDPADPQIVLLPSNAVTMPSVVGETVGEAEQSLQALGLSVTVRSLFDRQESAVTGQHPASGTRLVPGTLVVVSAVF